MARLSAAAYCFVAMPFMLATTARVMRAERTRAAAWVVVLVMVGSECLVGGFGRRFVIRCVNYRSFETRRKPACDESPPHSHELPISPTNRVRSRVERANAAPGNDKARRSGPWKAERCRLRPPWRRAA